MKRSIIATILVGLIALTLGCSPVETTPATEENKAEANAETTAATSEDTYYEVILEKWAEKIATEEQWNKFFNPEDIHKLAELEKSFYNPKDGDIIMLPADGKSFTHFSSAANADLVYAQVVVVKSVDENELAKIEEGVELYMLKEMLAKNNIYKVVAKP
jgi:hypothetical protein